MSTKLSELILLAGSGSSPTPEQIGDHHLKIVDNIAWWFEKAQEMGTADAYGALQNRVEDLREDLRESVQALTHDQMRQIIRQLRGNEPVTEEDLQLIRLWVVGDADAYVVEENNFGDWIDEIRRLGEEIGNSRLAPVEPKHLKKLQALLTDARGVIGNIANFLTHKERVDRFEETMSGGLDDDGRQILADILSRAYESSRA
jgi:hypothetical protein